jgi:hypothetical protein
MLKMLLAGALAAALTTAPGIAQEKNRRPLAGAHAVLVGLPVFTSDGREIGKVTGMARDQDEPMLIAEIERRLGIGSRTVAIPIDMFVQRPDRIELTLTPNRWRTSSPGLRPSANRSSRRPPDCPSPSLRYTRSVALGGGKMFRAIVALALTSTPCASNQWMVVRFLAAWLNWWAGSACPEPNAVGAHQVYREELCVTRKIVPLASSLTSRAPSRATAMPAGRPHTVPSSSTNPVIKSS